MLNAEKKVTIELMDQGKRKFVSENFTSRGMISDMAIHMQGKSPGDIPNPHVHVLVPMRPLKEDGAWGTKQRREYVLDEPANKKSRLN